MNASIIKPIINDWTNVPEELTSVFVSKVGIIEQLGWTGRLSNLSPVKSEVTIYSYLSIVHGV